MSVTPDKTKRMRLLLGGGDKALFVVQLMTRQDLQAADRGGSFYTDDFTDYVADLHAFMQRTGGRGKVAMTFGFVDEQNLTKIAAEMMERGKHQTLTMADLVELMQKYEGED